MKKPVIIALAGALCVVATATFAQPQQQAAQSKGPPNALQGFSQNRDQPVHIEAATLEVRDKEKLATFSGNVRVKQGDTNLRSRSLLVFYEQDDADKSKAKPAAAKPANTMQAATPGPGGEQKIKRLEARGSVVVTQKDQTATGELGIFDMQSNTVTLTGNVVMTQGPNVLKGEKLVVDLTTGVSKVEGKNGQGRVQGLFLPSSGGGINMPSPTAPLSGQAQQPAPQQHPAQPQRPAQGPMNLRPN
jgi:lipopolysaccharide export system protein LptA